MVPKTLIRKVEKSLVTPVVMRQHHRSANRSAELILLEGCFVGIEVIGGVKSVITYKFPHISVQNIGSGFGHDVYNSAQNLTKLRLVIVGLKFEFLNVI